MSNSIFAKLSVFTVVFAGGLATVVGCASAPDGVSGTLRTEMLDEEALGETGESSSEIVKGRSCGGRAGNTCTANQFCKFTRSAICGRADAQGTCTAKPTRCAPGNSPVCACDGTTFASACLAAKSGLGVLSSGACPIVPVACNVDAECTDAELGPNNIRCGFGTRPTKACNGESGTCGWTCKLPAAPSDCPVGQKKCMTCGAPPPDGICRSFMCVANNQKCPLVP